MTPGHTLHHDNEWHHSRVYIIAEEDDEQDEDDMYHGQRRSHEQTRTDTHIRLPPARTRSYEQYVQGHSYPPDAAPEASGSRPRNSGRHHPCHDDSEIEVEVEVERRRRRKKVSFQDDEDGNAGRRRSRRDEGREGGRERERRRERSSLSLEGRGGHGPERGRCGGGHEGYDRDGCAMSGALPERTVWRRRVVHRWEDEDY
jgi:hypothetical protein